MKLLQRFGLDGLSNDQIRLLLKVRYPLVCERYLKGTCGYGTSCPNVHVCVKFLQGQCDGCSLQHEGGLKNAHAKRLMKEFHIEERNFRSSVMLPKPNSMFEMIPLFILLTVLEKLNLSREFDPIIHAMYAIKWSHF